jgi:16S rRNA (uracil1498-N3)-methyltransferase
VSLLRAFHLGPLPSVGGEITLTPDESAHLVRVRRARVGETIAILDGRGVIATGPLAAADPHAARVRVENISRQPPPPVRELAVGLPKGGLLEDIIRSATELGVTAIQPLLTARSETRLADPARAARKLARWQAAALEAAKQSGNPWPPALRAPQTLATWLSEIKKSPAAKLVASLEPDARALSQLKTQNPKLETREALLETPNPKLETLVAVGPEGDFAPDEYSALRTAGFLPLRLPGHILRVETACAAALAILG